jgi:nitrogen fixation protein FixH
MNQSKIENQKSQIPNPWPIALTLVIGSAFAFATWVAITMIRQHVDLVPEEHYQRDLMHNERMAAEQRAAALEPPVNISLTAEREIDIRFPDASATGRLRLYRPADASMDVQIEIAPDPDGQQLVPARHLASGKWEVRMEWTQQSQTYAQTTTLILP